MPVNLCVVEYFFVAALSFPGIEVSYCLELLLLVVVGIVRFKLC